jgi:hypothetical protein
MTARRRGLVAGLLAALALVPASGCTQARVLSPAGGWQRIFTLEWQAEQRGDRQVIAGYVTNVSNYQIENVQLLLEGVDGAGQVLDQRVVRVRGDMGGGSRMFFEFPMSSAPAYRVEIFSYDRVELGNFL